MTKKQILTLLVLSFLTIPLHAQIFNTAGVLKPGKLSLGVGGSTTIVQDNNNRFLFLSGGLGLNHGVDMAVKFGIGATNYYAADFEWALTRNLSFTAGAHHYGNIGLDGTLLLNIPITGITNVYFGGDMDVQFEKFNVPIWIPIGVEVVSSSGIAIMLGASYNITNDAYHYLEGGLFFYL